MKNVLGIAHPELDLGRATPMQIAPRDPYGGDETLVLGGSHADYLRHAERIGHAGPMAEAEHDDIDAQFESVYRQILDGALPWDAIEPIAEQLLVAGAPRHDARPLPEVEEVVPDGLLADIAENQLPQVGMVAPDRVLGPWADEPISGFIRVVAAAVMGFAPEVPPGVPAWARACKRRPRPPAVMRHSLRSMARVPPMVWRIAADGTVVNHLAIADRMKPDGPVRGLPPAPAVVARMMPTATGWHASCALPLPRVPPVDVIERRLGLELLRLRRRERRLTWEDGLRERCTLVYRACSEWLWLQYADRESPVPW